MPLLLLCDLDQQELLLHNAMQQQVQDMTDKIKDPQKFKQSHCSRAPYLQSVTTGYKKQAIKHTVHILSMYYFCAHGSHVNLFSLEELKCFIVSKPSIVVEKSFRTTQKFYSILIIVIK